MSKTLFRRVILIGTLLLSFAGSASADVVTAIWDRNLEPDIATYILSFGTQSGQYTTAIDVGNLTSRQVTLNPGQRYFFIVQARNTAGRLGPASTEVSVDLTTQAPTLAPTAINFGAVNVGGTLTVATPPQTIAVTQTSPGPWTASADRSWITLSPTSGTGSGTLTASINNTGGVLPASGVLTGTISVTSAGGTRDLPVRLTLRPAAQQSAPPFGVFDTPAASSTIQGSIAVTGWALDDTGIDRVEIWRDLVPGETTPPFNAPGHPGHGKVFIARPLFIAGSRTDVEAAYPLNPLAHRAGWGYLLLTWGLPNQGNGPVSLHAFAFDQEGNSATLGTKTVTASNATATRPFGGIDVPAYGETKSGLFFNFGWALTPNPNAADTRSCTITNGSVLVGIDSGPLTPVAYGDNRTDIAGAFPGFSNGGSGGGHYLIDTTTMPNGTHQIGWFVTDTCGRSDGIGSRFFTVLNGSSLVAADASNVAADRSTAASHVGRTVSGPQTDAGSTESGSIAMRLTGGDWTPVQPNAANVHVVEIGQSDRVELQLPSAGGARFTGSQMVNGERRSLPLGSSFDAERGVFYWQPAAGFLGGFDLEFVRSIRLQEDPAAVRVRVVVGAPMRMAIDTPQNGGSVAGPLVIAGWALDLAATDGSGIDTVHVWAYAAGGTPNRAEQNRQPIFLGVASVGDPRPDVAAVYGAQFERSSYSLTAALAPGTYNIVVYPHRATTGAFDGAQMIRVTVR